MNWKIIPGFSHYEISETGKIFSHFCGRELALHRNKFGYLQTRLVDDSGAVRCVVVHRLLLMAFKPIANHALLECAHTDGNPRNNSLSNLRWATVSENALDRVRHGRQFSHSTKINHLIARVIRRLLTRGISQRRIGALWGISGEMVGMIGRGLYWKGDPA